MPQLKKDLQVKVRHGKNLYNCTVDPLAMVAGRLPLLKMIKA